MDETEKKKYMEITQAWKDEHGMFSLIQILASHSLFCLFNITQNRRESQEIEMGLWGAH